MFKLGVMVTDKASGIKGYLCHMQIQGTAQNPLYWYNFQPAQLNPEDGLPTKRNWITPNRVEGGVIVAGTDVDLQVLGTKATEPITGFKGVVTGIIIHFSGCVHLELQPEGQLNKTGEMKPCYDFDIRMLQGPAIPKLTEKQKEESKQKNPSPMEAGRLGPRQR